MRTATVSLLYAFRLLRAHGLSGQRLYDIVVATAIARLTYATPAWVGYITADQKARIRASIRKLQRQDFLPSDQADFDDLCKKADIRLFHSILSNKNHVLHKFLTPIKDLKYQLKDLGCIILHCRLQILSKGLVSYLECCSLFNFCYCICHPQCVCRRFSNKVCTYLLTYLKPFRNINKFVKVMSVCVRALKT